jgi:hypothetical protein
MKQIFGEKATYFFCFFLSGFYDTNYGKQTKQNKTNTIHTHTVKTFNKNKIK